MAKPAPILGRLAGLETEYAVRFHPDAGTHAGADARAADRPSNFKLYDLMIAELRRVIPAAPAHHVKKGFFLANGGAVWYEKVRPGADAGLFEGATPECRGPRRLLAHQRAQDGLLSAAARDVSTTGEVTLCKSDCDARGNVYGAQENYELRAVPHRLAAAVAAGTILLLPVLILSSLAELVVLAATGIYLLLATQCYLLVRGAMRALRREPHRDGKGLLSFLFAREAQLTSSDPFLSLLAALPWWLEPAGYWGMRVADLPFLLGAKALFWAVGYPNLRRQMLPFLVSRAIVCGTGRLTPDGGFAIASKAHRMDCVTGLNASGIDRPVFNYGHWLKSLICGMDAAKRDKMSPLSKSVSRLQISIGDSNLCEEAEYLRVGTTMLVLDAIEAGAMPPVPRLRRPLKALRTIIADPTLEARVRLSRRRNWTAIQIQRFYLDACKRFLAARPDAPAEAHDLVRRWEDVLDRLETDPRSLVGRIDWVTKRMLLERCAAGEPWPVRKKIDLRYHELSPEGYFHRLCAAGVARPVLSEDEVEAARHHPPPDSPATERGRLIREHACGRKIRVNWEGVALG